MDTIGPVERSALQVSTLLEACGRADLEPPRSRADLVHILHTLRDRGIWHNLLGSPIMRLADGPCWCVRERPNP
jgi:hypothetical protein